MSKKVLIVDKDYAEEFNLDDCLYLFPSIGYKPKWTLNFDEHTTHHHQIVKIRSKLASYIAKEIYCPALGYSEEACERLFLNYGSLLIFILSDRLLRLNKLLQFIPKEDILIFDVDFEFNKNWSFGYLYYNKAEMDPIYNQWIVKRLMPENEIFENQNKNKTQPEYTFSEFYDNQQSFSSRILRNIKQGTFFSKFINLSKNLYSNFILKLSFYLSKIPIDSKNVNFLEMKKNLHTFFWPFGRLVPLNSHFFKVVESSNQSKISREDFFKHEDFISNLFREMLIECQGNINLPESSLNAITGLLVDQLPVFTTEQADIYCKKYLKEFKKYQGSFFIADGTGGGTLKSLRMFACKELSIPVIATQHSAWGGYLANGPLVSELLIEGSDHYISFGWKNQTDGEASWKHDAITLPSPMLSELEKKNSNNRFIDTRNKNVAFCLGFIYRFPGIYNSFLRCDIINEYLEVIENTFKELTKEGFKVTVFLYNSQVAEIFGERLDSWKNIGKGNLVIYPNHELRIRNYIQRENIDDLYDAFVWDIPAGGFSESLACGKKTFALFDEKIIKPTEEAKSYINQLKKEGIFFNNGEDLVSNLLDMIKTDGWYKEKGRMQAINNFKQQYFKTSQTWKEEWNDFFLTYKV